MASTGPASRSSGADGTPRPSAHRPGVWTKTALALLVVAALTGRPTEGSANPMDTFGHTARAAAMGSAGVADIEGPAAAHYNAAGVARGAGYALGLGLTAAATQLDVNGEEHATDALILWDLGLAGPLPLGRELSRRLSFGVALALPATALYELRQPDDRAVAFSLLDQRNRRLALTASVAWRVAPWLRLGAGFALLPDVPGEVTLDLDDPKGETSTAIDIDYNFTPTAGLQVDLPWGAALGLSYRKGQHLTIDLPVDVNVSEGMAVGARVVGPAYSTPTHVAAGLAWNSSSLGLALEASLTWYGYAELAQDAPTVALLDSNGEVTQEHAPLPPGMGNVLCPRAGGEWWATSWLALRAGYGYHPTPVPAQTGVTNILDADRHVVSLGLGFEVPSLGDWGPSSVRLDLHGQVQILEDIAWEKEEVLVGNPGYPTIVAGGTATSAGIGLEVRP